MNIAKVVANKKISRLLTEQKNDQLADHKAQREKEDK